MCLFATRAAEAGALCTPFRVHPSAPLPAAPSLEKPNELPSGWEEKAAERIGRIPTQADFPVKYRLWLKQNSLEMTETERFVWLNCLYHYVSQDSNGNGVPDWTALVDHQPTQILYPEDPDQDGDGIPNILDSNPLDSRQGEKRVENSMEIPSHLRINRSDSAALQDRLYREFGVLAIDHTDEHSPAVLQGILFLMENSFSRGTQFKHFRYVYAFAGHNTLRNVASFHWQAKALSTGGRTSYPRKLSDGERVGLLSTLAHELGHAVLFEKMTGRELVDASVKFAGWTPLSEGQLKDSFFSSGLFKPFLGKHGKNIVSRYSLTNRHEWFAESWSGAVLHKLDQKGLLGKEWQERLKPRSSSQADPNWVDFSNMRADFREWLEAVGRK